MGLFRQSSENAIDEDVSKLVKHAEGDSITGDRLVRHSSPGLLNGNGYLTTPVVDHLQEEEQPHHIISSTEPVRRKNEQAIVTEEWKNVVVFTDKRMLVLIGGEDGDEEYTIDYDTIQSVEISYTDRDAFENARSVKRHNLVVATIDEIYSISIPDTFGIEKPPLSVIVDYIRDTSSLSVSRSVEWSPSDFTDESTKSNEVTDRENEGIANYSEDLAALAEGDSVSMKRLRISKGDGIFTRNSADRSVLEVLEEDEEPQYMFSVEHPSESAPIIIDGGSESEHQIDTNSGAKYWCVVTNERFILLAGHSEETSIKISEINDVGYIPVPAEKRHKNGEANRLRIWADNTVYDVYLNSTLKEEELKNSSEYLHPSDCDPSDLNISGSRKSGFERVTVCRKCHEEVSSETDTCPHCGYSPKEDERGGAYWAATTAATLANPLAGGYLTKKGHDRNKAAWKGVGTEVEKRIKSDSPVEDSSAEKSPLDQLERIRELKESGAINEEEFTQLKKNILEDI